MSEQPNHSDERHAGENDDRAEGFVRIFAAHHQRLFAYIMAMMHDRTDAEEVFQETSLVLWREFPKFRSEEPFMPWACGIAFNQMRKFWRQRKRDKLTFSLALLEDLARESIEMQDEVESRKAALTECMKSVPARDRAVLELYYGAATTADDVAGRLEKSVHAIYKSLHRTRRRLYECIARRLSGEQRSV